MAAAGEPTGGAASSAAAAAATAPSGAARSSGAVGAEHRGETPRTVTYLIVTHFHQTHALHNAPRMPLLAVIAVESGTVLDAPHSTPPTPTPPRHSPAAGLGRQDELR
jgi:hypothetical protein